MPEPFFVWVGTKTQIVHVVDSGSHCIFRTPCWMAPELLSGSFSTKVPHSLLLAKIRSDLRKEWIWYRSQMCMLSALCCMKFSGMCRVELFTSLCIEYWVFNSDAINLASRKNPYQDELEDMALDELLREVRTRKFKCFQHFLVTPKCALYSCFFAGSRHSES